VTLSLCVGPWTINSEGFRPNNPVNSAGLKSHSFGDKDRRHVREVETAQSIYNTVLLKKVKLSRINMAFMCLVTLGQQRETRHFSIIITTSVHREYRPFYTNIIESLNVVRHAFDFL